MSPRFALGRENVPCVAKVVNRSLKADCTDFTAILWIAFLLLPGKNDGGQSDYRTQITYEFKWSDWRMVIYASGIESDANYRKLCQVMHQSIPTANIRPGTFLS